tara:strand:+ start:70 stop:1614 length:1545 start_codon:yes stop_codon:yes gene_type:complete
MIIKKIKAKSQEQPLDVLRKMFGKIYSDEELLQRYLEEWNKKTSSDHMVAFLEGHSNIYSIVLVNILSVLEDCHNKQSEFEKGEDEYKNIQDTINYLEGIQKKGNLFLCIDGQHRVDCYERYMKDEFVILEDVICNIPQETGEDIPYNLKKKKFSKLPDYVKKYILTKYNVLLTFIETGNFEDIVKVTIYTNIGEPWNEHESRIIIPSTFVRFCLKYINTDALFSNVFKDYCSDMNKKYSLKKKGLSRILTEFLGYYFNTTQGNIYKWPKEEQLNKMCSIVGLKGLSKNKLDNGKTICSKLAEVINTLDDISINRSQIYNLFILLCCLFNSKHKLNTFNKKLVINDNKGFINWFLEMELKLRKKNKYILDQDGNFISDPAGKKDRKGNIKKVENPEAFIKKCSNNGEDEIQIRLESMYEKFVNDYNSLFAEGIIDFIEDEKVSKGQRETVAVNSDFTTKDGEKKSFEEIFGKGNDIDVDHETATRLGGEHNENENMVLRTASKNRSKGKKVEKV